MVSLRLGASLATVHNHCARLATRPFNDAGHAPGAPDKIGVLARCAMFCSVAQHTQLRALVAHDDVRERVHVRRSVVASSATAASISCASACVAGLFMAYPRATATSAFCVLPSARRTRRLMVPQLSSQLGDFRYAQAAEVRRLKWVARCRRRRRSAHQVAQVALFALLDVAQRADVFRRRDCDVVVVVVRA